MKKYGLILDKESPDWRLEYCDWMLTSAGCLPAWRVIDLLQGSWFEMLQAEIEREDIWQQSAIEI